MHENYKSEQNLQTGRTKKPQHIKNIRLDETYRQKEQQQNINQIHSLRTVYLNNKKLANKNHMQTLRKCVSYSAKEAAKNQNHIQNLREDDNYTLQERKKNLKHFRNAREN